MLNRIKRWKEKRQIQGFFRPNANVWLMDTSNSRMRKYIGCSVTLSWVDEKLLIRPVNADGCISTSSVLEKECPSPDAVVFRTANSTYRFCKYANV